jgi:hypothetical protein
MLDSGWDVDLPTSKGDLIAYKFGGGSEGKRNAVGGSPNSLGVSDKMLGLVVKTLAEPDIGLCIVGLHAPLISLPDEEYPYFLRETQRTALRQVYDWLGRHDIKSHDIKVRPSGFGEKTTRKEHPSWFAAHGNPDAVSYVKRGDPSDFLDYGVSKGRAYELLKVLAGVGQSRPADLVLHGHIHRYNEFRVAVEGGDLAYYMDFYMENPAHYYPTTFVIGWAPDGSGNLWEKPLEAETYVDIASGAKPGNAPTKLPNDPDGNYKITIPPYATPLSSATDPRAWWSERRPIVLQTEALGPFKNADANLAGFRVLSVKDDSIERVHFLSIERLHASNYRLDWKDVVQSEVT